MTPSNFANRAARLRLSWEMLGSLLTFIGIGGSAAGAFVVLSTVVIDLNPVAPAWLVSAACYAVMILPVYLLHRRFSFRSEASHRQALPRYVVVQCVGLVLTAMFSWLVHGRLALPTVFASIVVVAMTSGVNFVVLRSWAFATKQADVLPGFQ